MNLRRVCEIDQVGPDGQRIELLKWKSKYHAEIMDICLIEIVQIVQIDHRSATAAASMVRHESSSNSRHCYKHQHPQ